MSRNSSQWLKVINDEMKSMKINEVWDLIELSIGVRSVGCKWVYKTKIDSQGNIKGYKARLIVRWFTQQEWTRYNNIFSSVSKKDSLWIILALVVHYDLELHQMNVKTIFL
jgi:Reverse transcriptase (RNA-dependent DNA polymerase)